MADPDKFDGQRSKLRGFLVKLRLKLQEPKAFRDEQAKLRYIVGRLEGLALDQVMSFVIPSGIDFDTVDDMIDHLKTCFDDPDRMGTATRALRTTKQGTRDFATYFAEFQRYALQVDWNQAAIRSALKDGLSTELENALITVDEPEDYTEFTNLLMKIDTKLKATKARHPSRPTAPAHNPRIHTNRYGNTGSGSSVPPNPTASNSGNYGPAPMDLSANRRKLTPEERSRRIAQGLCLYCGGAGHMAHECPNRGAGRMRGAEMSLAPLLPTTSVDESTTATAGVSKN